MFFLHFQILLYISHTNMKTSKQLGGVSPLTTGMSLALKSLPLP